MDVLFVLTSLAFINFINSDQKFREWEDEYDKSYEDDNELKDAKQTFDMNTAIINLANSKLERKYKLGLNEFSDKNFEKFCKSSLGIIVPENLNKVTYSYTYSFMDAKVQARLLINTFIQVTPPTAIDYRNYSLGVLNQMNCGSCWAFSALGVLESRMKILNFSYATLLSEQYLIDCDTRDFSCNGGWPFNALNWIVQQGGNAVPAMTSYQYYGFKTNCRAVTKIPMNIKATVQNYTAGNENMMKEIVANVGPVAAVIYVTPFLQLYKSGIFYDTTCNNNCSNVNHAVIIVGYDIDPVTKLDYWIVKNSWGKSWGQGGYAYMSRNKGNNCNIACYAMYVL